MTGSGCTGRSRVLGAIRKIAAGALLGGGIAGLVSVAATQLDSAWSGDFQAGSTPTGEDCQPPGQPILGRLAGPVFVGTCEQPWAVTQVEFLDIGSDCVGREYQIAYRAGDDWMVLGSDSAHGTITGSTVTANLDGLPVDGTTEFAISIYR